MNENKSGGRLRGRGRTRWLCLCLAAFLLVMAAGSSRAAMYKYKDDKGVTHFVENPDRVPERYRSRVTEVDDHVTTVKDYGEEGNDSITGRLGIFGRGDGPSRPLTSRLAIIAFSLWSSRLVFTVVIVIFLAGGLVIGMRRVRDVPRAFERKRYTRLMPVSCVLALVFLWLSMAGPACLRFLDGCEDRSAEGIAAKELDAGTRARLAGFKDGCARWRDRLDKVVY